MGRRRHVMGKFLCVHPVGGDMDLEAATPLGRAVKANSTVDAYWVRSWYVPEEGKFYCEWDAKDADAVREVITAATAQIGAPFPLEGVYAIAAMATGEDYRS
jgi:hypothetical protein